MENRLTVRLQAFYDAHSSLRDAQCILDAIERIEQCEQSQGLAPAGKTDE